MGYNAGVSMKGFALLLFVYLALDVANPFMPGVVRFVDGSLDVVDAERVRGKESVAPLFTATIPAGRALVEMRSTPEPAGPVGRHPPLRSLPIRRPSRPPSDSISSPGDH